jgi:hypothetical protein
MVKKLRLRERGRHYEWPLLAGLALVSFSTPLMAQETTKRVTHILGFGDAANNANGELSIREGSLRFQKKDAAQSAQVDLNSIQDVVLGQQDRQMGGTAMAVSRAATPYGGGRVIALFSHKKYDTVTLEYRDPNGGFHGAIFQMDKGQGEALKTELVAKGAHLKLTNTETKNETK